MPRTLLIPVETAAREFDGKLLLALTARERGWDVFLGSQGAMRHRYASLPKGVYLSKSARRDNNKYFSRMRAYGHRIAVLDEEVLIRESDDIFNMKHEIGAFKDVELVLTWGDDSKKFLQKLPQLKNVEIVATGNPRIDMLSKRVREYYSQEVEKIKSQHGEYVLFNSNFSNVNHFIPGHTRFKLASWVSKSRQTQIFSDLKARKISLMDSFVRLVPELAEKIAPKKLIIRPHPSESDEIWKRAIQGNENAAVVFQGSVVPWILGAEAVVHSGCTTAVEATMLGVPCVSLSPFSDQDLSLPDSLSLRCSTEGSVIETVDDLLRGQIVFDPSSTTNKNLVADYIRSDPGELNCSRILDQLERKFCGPQFDAEPGDSHAAKANIYEPLKETAKRLFLKTRWGRSSRLYSMRKFPELKEDFIEDQIGVFQSVLSDFDGVKLQKIDQNLFCLK